MTKSGFGLVGVIVMMGLGCDARTTAPVETVTVTTVVVVTETATPAPKTTKTVQVSKATPVPARVGPCGKLPPREELLTWKTKILKYSCCQGSQGPAPPPGGYPPCTFDPSTHRGIALDLKDGTYLVKESGGCVRARFRPECRKKCLPVGTRIATPLGDVVVESLRVGDPVWTRDRSGNRVRGTVLRTSRVATPPDHEIVHARLQDGRTIRVSAGHPDMQGLGVEQWSAGDRYDNTQIVEVHRLEYDGGWTYDLLTSGETGIYWADDVPLTSTLEP